MVTVAQPFVNPRYSARPKWLPYSDGRLVTSGDPDEELQLIWTLVDNNACDFDRAAKRWNLLWDRLQKRATLPPMTKG
jgi:hypothetical protein